MNKTSNEKINEVIELMKMFDVHIKEKSLNKNLLTGMLLFFLTQPFDGILNWLNLSKTI